MKNRGGRADDWCMENLDFIVLAGTILFFALLHQWPPDGRRWETPAQGGSTPDAERSAESLDAEAAEVRRDRAA